ncbi:hypothetical protein JKP88DRAFT_348937 [Tribonema minus]|uniref:Endonuclease/exonuclease/phosphatase domain-containing protein n=1 Tax=Tribonema minus TaxID=303371 RepID=A0A835YZB1_9STRA|nr:hypothetical protein JKP88DRAFT_348937 [Tribonema minus]
MGPGPPGSAISFVGGPVGMPQPPGSSGAPTATGAKPAVGDGSRAPPAHDLLHHPVLEQALDRRAAAGLPMGFPEGLGQNTGLRRGLEFPDSRTCVQYLRDYMVGIGKRLATDQTGGKSKRFKCSGNGCPFIVNVTKTRQGIWRVTNVIPEHSEECDGVPIGSRPPIILPPPRTNRKTAADGEGGGGAKRGPKPGAAAAKKRLRVEGKAGEMAPGLAAIQQLPAPPGVGGAVVKLPQQGEGAAVRKRVTLMSWNVWKMEGVPALFPQRAAAFKALLQTYAPDVLCVQELHPVTSAAIRQALLTHASTADGGAETPPPPPTPVAMPILPTMPQVDPSKPPQLGLPPLPPPQQQQQPLPPPAGAPLQLGAPPPMQLPMQPQQQMVVPALGGTSPPPPASAALNNMAAFNAPAVPPPGAAMAAAAAAAAAAAVADRHVKGEETAAGDEAAAQQEGGIFYNTKLFILHAAGAEELNLPEHPHRKLHYCVLKIEATIRVITILAALATHTFPFIHGNHNPVFLLGDFNEDFHPPRLLSQAMYQDCFSALGVPAPHTHPARPSHPKEEERPDRTLDWVFSTGQARAVLASVVRDFRVPGSPPGEVAVHPSDHFPVVACYEI